MDNIKQAYEALSYGLESGASNDKLRESCIDACAALENHMAKHAGMFTVFGYYDDSGQAFSDVVAAADAYGAMAVVASGPDVSDTLCIVGAVAGVHQLVTPGCDNGLCAFVRDLAPAPRRYNHVFTVAFSVDSEFTGEQTENISAEDCIEALQKRLDYLRANPVEAGEAFVCTDIDEEGLSHE